MAPFDAHLLTPRRKFIMHLISSRRDFLRCASGCAVAGLIATALDKRRPVVGCRGRQTTAEEGGQVRHDPARRNRSKTSST